MSPARFQTNYLGKPPETERDLNQLGIRPDRLYGIKYTERFPTMVDEVRELVAMGRNLLSRLKGLCMRGDICIQGPAIIIGENQ